MASKVLAGFTKEEIEYYHQISKEKYELDMQCMIVDTRHHAMQKGMQRGMQKGIQKGIQKERQEVINLLKSGKPLEQIIQEYEAK